MSYSQPTGFRLPGSVSLTEFTRTLDQFMWPMWRVEAVLALASVTIDLLNAPTERDAVLRRLSHNQIGEADLVFSVSEDRGLLHRAAEFLDVGHARMHRPSAVPLPAKLDLRCRAQFMDDPEDPDRAWTYVLSGTQHHRLEQLFHQLPSIEPYPVATTDDPPPDPEADPAWEARCAVWGRVLAPYGRSEPLSLAAPDPQIAFDIVDSLTEVGRDALLMTEGKVTVTAVLTVITRRLGDATPQDLRDRLVAPIRG